MESDRTYARNHHQPQRGRPMRQCETIRANGEPCRAQALPDRNQCWAHDGSTRERANAARRLGGTNRSTLVRASRRMPKDMADLSRRLLEAFAEVHSGELAPDRAHAMSRIAAVFVQLHSAVEVDARIEALEQAASGRKGYGS